MSDMKFYVDVNLQDNEVVKLKADTLDITTNLASANTKRIVYWAGDYYYSDGTNWVQMSGGNPVTSVTATTPLSSTGGATPDISISQANTTTNGYLSSTDWTTFNGKQNALGYTPVNLAGDTMLGYLILNADPGTALGAATKQYVDNIATGINFHAPVVAATTSPLPAVTYSNGIGGVGATLIATSPGALTIDTVTFSGGGTERVLIKNQGSALENGIYVVNIAGDALTPFQLTRATDADNSPAGELAFGDFCFVEQGPTNGGFGYILNTIGTITVGVTSISYVIFNAAQVVTAGTGLTELPTNTLNIDITKVPYYSGGFSAGFAKWNGSNWIFDNSTYITSAALTPYLTSATAAATYYPIPTGTTSQYLRGDGTLATFPTIPSITPAALTKVDDTNVTLSLGGSPSNALLQGVSLTLGWTGTLADSRIASAATWNAKFTLPALTSGSVLFSDGTTITQDNANFFWDDTNNRLGIGNNTPTEALTVTGNMLLNLTGSTSVKIYNFSGGINTYESAGPTLISSTGANYLNIRAGGDFGIQTNGSTTNKLSIKLDNSNGNIQTQFTSTLFGQSGCLATTEVRSVLFSGASKTWQNGNIATQRWFHITANTAAFASAASTITNSYGLYVEAAVAGTNATITNNYALGLGGSLGLSESANIVLGTTTGTKIGTATTQKLGFFNATPIVQPAAVTTVQGIADRLTDLGFLTPGSVVSGGTSTSASAALFNYYNFI